MRLRLSAADDRSGGLQEGMGRCAPESVMGLLMMTFVGTLGMRQPERSWGDVFDHYSATVSSKAAQFQAGSKKNAQRRGQNSR